MTGGITPLDDGRDFLIALCRWQALGGDKPRLAGMRRRWGDILGEAASQKLTPLLARYFTVPPGEAAMPYRLALDLIEAGRARAESHAEAVRTLQAELMQIGAPSLVRKGLVYGKLFYGDWAFRAQVDNDLFVPPSKREAVREYFEAKGYINGDWSAVSMRIEPLPRSMLLLYRLNPDHLPHMSRYVDRPFCNIVRFDVAFDMAWHGSDYPGLESILEAQFDHPQEVAGLMTMNKRAHFLDCLLHTFREGFHENAIQDGIDVNLRKFLDLWLIWLSLDEEARSAVRSDIQAFGLANVAGWLGTHIDSLFGAGLLEQLGLDSSYDRRKANEWKSYSGEIRTWSGTMRDRLFAADRKALFDGLSDEARSSAA